MIIRTTYRKEIVVLQNLPFNHRHRKAHIIALRQCNR
jgi:hypothetical protein